MNIRRVTYGFIREFADEAYRDGAWITEGSTPILWWGLFDKDTYLGSVGMLVVGAGVRARVRGWYVRRQYRGNGYGVMLLKAVVAQAQNRGVSTLECRTKHHELCLSKMPGVWTDIGEHYQDGGRRLEAYL